MKIGDTVKVIKIADLADKMEVSHTLGMVGKIYCTYPHRYMVEFDTKECYCYSQFELEVVE